MKNGNAPNRKLGVLGVKEVFGTYIKIFHEDANCIYDLANSYDKFQWLPCHEEFFQKLKAQFREDISNAIPNVNYPIHIHADSLIGVTGCILIQDFPEGKRMVSANSRVFD